MKWVKIDDGETLPAVLGAILANRGDDSRGHNPRMQGHPCCTRTRFKGTTCRVAAIQQTRQERPYPTCRKGRGKQRHKATRPLNLINISPAFSLQIVQIIRNLCLKKNGFSPSTRPFGRKTRILGHGPKNLIFKPFSWQAFAIGPLSRKILAKILCDKGFIAMRKRLYRTAKEAFRQRRKGLIAIGNHENRRDGTTF